MEAISFSDFSLQGGSPPCYEVTVKETNSETGESRSLIYKIEGESILSDEELEKKLECMQRYKQLKNQHKRLKKKYNKLRKKGDEHYSQSPIIHSAGLHK